MKTIEQIFLDTKLILEQQAVKAVEDALDKIYQEYLPHVENDTGSNVYYQSTAWIRSFLSDKLTEDDFKIDVLAKDVRKKIWEDNKEELKELISNDVAERLAYLEKELVASWQHKYY